MFFHDYGAHLVVGKMWKGILWLGYAMKTSAAKTFFIILKVASILGVQQKVKNLIP